MKIKLIKGWNGQGAGTLLDPPIDEVATRLIARGYAVEIEPEPEAAPKTKREVKLQSWVKKPETN